MVLLTEPLRYDVRTILMLVFNIFLYEVWDLATDKVGWVGAACRATMVGHMHTVRCLQVSIWNLEAFLYYIYSVTKLYF